MLPTCLPVSLLGVSSSHPQRSYDSSMRSARRTRCSMRAACAPAATTAISDPIVEWHKAANPCRDSNSLPVSASSLQSACGYSADAKSGRMLKTLRTLQASKPCRPQNPASLKTLPGR